MEADIAKLVQILQAVVVGHVDVGKSSLVGKLFFQYGDREFLKRKLKDIKTSMEGKQMSGGAAGAKADSDNPTTELRYLCDNSSHERAKGNTINYHSTGVTVKYPGTEDRFVNFCDAPGHFEFTKNFVAGTTQADIAVMLLPASQLALASSMKPMDSRKGAKGESSKKLPSVLDNQLRILNTFKVPILLVCVNKMAGGATSHTGNETGTTTDITPYDQDMYNRICSTANEIIKKNGFKEGWYHFMPIDVFNGDNLWEKSKNMSWWKGIDFAPNVPEKAPYNPGKFHADSLVEFLAKMPLPPRRYKDPLKMCIHNIYNVGGQGSVYSCKIFAGLCKSDQAVLHCPVYFNTKIKSIEVHKTKREVVGVGDECAVTLFKTDSLKPPIKGHVLCTPEFPTPKVHAFVAKVMFFGVQEEIKSGFTCTWDCHVVHCTVTFERILDATNKNTGGLTLTGSEPECITWNPVLSAEQLKNGKELQRKKNADAKFKLTDEDQKLLKKVNDPYSFDPCGNAHLDSLTTPLVGGKSNKNCIVRLKPMDTVICTTFQANSGMGRFCLRSCNHVLGIGIITQVSGDSLDYIKKAAAKNK